MAPLDGAVAALVNATNATLCQTEEGRAQLPYCEMLQCEVERAPNTEYIGVGLQVLSVSISASCLLVMKLSTDYEKGLPLIPCRRGACHRNGWKWRFVTGWAANTASEAFISTLAFYFAPLSVLAPITGVGILVSALLAGTGYVPCFGFPPGFKEHISVPERVGLAVLLVAMVVTSWLGPSSEFTESYDQWQKEWSRPEVIGMFALSATFVVGWVSMLLLPCFRHVRPRGKSVPLALGSAFGAAAAGAYSQLFAKMVITAIVRSLVEGEGELVGGLWMTYAATVGLCTTAPLQIFLLHSSLGAGEAAFTIPCFFVMIMTLTILCSGIFFREFECMSSSQRAPLPKKGDANLVLFCACVLVVAATMLYLSCKQEQKKSRKLAKMRQIQGVDGRAQGDDPGGEAAQAHASSPLSIAQLQNGAVPSRPPSEGGRAEVSVTSVSLQHAAVPPGHRRTSSGGGSTRTGRPTSSGGLPGHRRTGSEPLAAAAIAAVGALAHAAAPLSGEKRYSQVAPDMPAANSTGQSAPSNRLTLPPLPLPPLPKSPAAHAASS